MYQAYGGSSETYTSERIGISIPHWFDVHLSRSLTSVSALRSPYLYVFLILIAELASSHFLYWGVALHAIVLVALLVHSVFATDKALSGFLSVMTIAPMIRIVSLSTPLSNFDETGRFAIVSIPVIICAVTIIRAQKISLRDMAICWPKLRYVPLELAVMALAVPIGFIEYQILKPEAIAEFELAKMVAPALVLIVMTGFVEEFIFRGLMQHSAERLAGLHGIVCVSVLFGVLHTTNVAYWDICLAGGAGFFFAIVVRKTGSLWGVSLAHGIVNITLFMIAPHLIAG